MKCSYHRYVPFASLLNHNETRAQILFHMKIENSVHAKQPKQYNYMRKLSHSCYASSVEQAFDNYELF